MYKKKLLIFSIMLLIITIFICSCGNSRNDGYVDIDKLKLEQVQMPNEGEEIAVMTTNYGVIKIRLFPEIAPKAVENFTTLAKEGFYDGKIFYRVRKDNYIQAGEENTGKSIWGDPFEDEFNLEYRHIRGALSMANRGPNTNRSNFFIVQGYKIENDIIEMMKELGEDDGYSKDMIEAYRKLGGLPDLDFKHTVFGQVFYGMDVVDAIANAEVDTISLKPFEPVVIQKIEIIPFKQ
ncbi:peptidylprolyl isomerase [Sporanaerobacter acetigenes]|uniref:peptidylprolyl isomerase n=1 Tax=Sporanaerobacter acetigenes TaxID=165813 RepID=UPI00331FC717